MKFLLPFNMPKSTNAQWAEENFKRRQIFVLLYAISSRMDKNQTNMAKFRQLRSTPLCNGVQHENDGVHTICGLAPTECLSIYESILNLEPPYELYTQALPNVFCIELTTASTNDKAAHRQTEPSVFSLVKSH